ncbi:MAG TPA: hypothetical protein VJS44_12370 [Pyrinomonadaceae bacterium]|nr:hypothetical protein [Pyrinomonadaceae bacterium]
MEKKFNRDGQDEQDKKENTSAFILSILAILFESAYRSGSFIFGADCGYDVPPTTKAR